MNTGKNDPTFSDIDAAYLTALFDSFRTGYPEYYILLEHATPEMFAIDLIYDHRKRRWAKTRNNDSREPIRTLTVQDFIKEAPSFHKYDKFAMSLVGGICYFENQFDSDIILTLLKQNINTDCRMAMHQDKSHLLLDELVAKYGFSPAELEDISGMLTDICKDIKDDLQCQYDHLVGLSFIKK